MHHPPPEPGAAPTAFAWTDPLEHLPLRLASSPTWIEVALADLDAVLIDHAFCEHKAAVSALAIINRYSDVPALVRPMLALAREEMMHMRQVLDVLDARNLVLGKPTSDRYVTELRRRLATEGEGLGGLGDHLLVLAFVEARSCERFRLLARALCGDADAERDRLGRFYRQLAEAEGRHWELFRDLACEVLPRSRVLDRIEQASGIEAEIVRSLPVEARMH
ncbi:MAG: tRNA isopentenyl-2-thiomethyl-A-37 hydroxylase MiaE [Planctomycetota bacterium]